MNPVDAPAEDAVADAVDEVALRILDATYAVLSANVGRRTTMNQIADQAGLGVATVYRRFPQKPQLMRALLLREGARLTEVVGEAMTREATVEMQAAAGFSAFAHAIAEHPFLVRLIHGDSDGWVLGGGDLADQLMAMARDYIAAWIRDLQEQGRYLGVDAEIVAEIEARLALSLIVAPDGKIPMHDEQASRAFALTYLVPLLGRE